jgi:catechol 2,3-dioxygenase-like lactoylglutathione lyase family enzyme
MGRSDCGHILSSATSTVPAMAITEQFQVAFDCQDPHATCRFWAEALGYEIVRDPDMIRDMLAKGVATDDDVLTLDGELVWRDGDACFDPEGTRPRMFFQRVPEPRVAKNRVHLDLRVPEADRPAEIERLTGLGARRVGEGQQGPHSWIVMTDPEGNEFCVA